MSEKEDSKPEMTENQKQAEEIKAEANKCFAAGHHLDAIDLYTKAIDLYPTAILYGNRSFSYLKLEQYGAAIDDATKSLQLDSKYAKAYYRRGTAHVGLGHYQKGLQDFKAAERIYPSSKEAKEKRQQCETTIRRLKFEEAIARPDEKPLSETLDVDEMIVESSYEGPKYENKMSIDFVKELMAHLKAEKTLHVKYVYKILIEAKNIFAALPSLLEIPIPKGGHFTVCGDVHGQFYDLLNIFELNGLPSEENPYLFNGDFVDRGSFSVEVMILLLAFKVLYPNHFHLHRGNHETISMNKMYGFEGEVTSKYSEKCFRLFTEVFNWLPLASVLGNQIFVVHGGLCQKDGVKLDEIKKISRNSQPPESGIYSDLLWSDPQPFPGRAPSKRGVGVSFGPDVTKAFLENNNLKMVVRSHEVKEEGYLVEADGKLVTVFSAPNYCDQVGNKGAYVIFDDECNPTYKSFSSVPHPAVKPMKYASSFF